MFALPRSATVPPFTGVFSLSFLGFTARASKIETPMSNARRDTIITVPRAFPILSINALSLWFSRVHVCGLSTTEHLFEVSAAPDLNTKQLLSTQSLDQALGFFLHLYNTYDSSTQVQIR